MKLKNIAICATVLTVLSGCGIIEKQITSEDSLKEKASFAIGVEPQTIAISNVQSGLEKVTFDANVNQSRYSCYYTTVLASESDAICRKISAANDTPKPTKKETNSECNDLLKAAGRCE